VGGARTNFSHAQRSAFIWGYGHIVVFASLAAIGGGLHVAAYYLERQTTLGPVGTVLSTAVPFAVYTAALYAIYAAFTRHSEPFHLVLLAATTSILVLSVALAALGVSVAACLLVLMFAPVVTVVGFETVGYRHVAAALERPN